MRLSNRTASSACSPPPASTPTRPPPASSNPSPPAAASVACSISKTEKFFFPDVDSRFKFCALIFGGEERRFAETECAFFLHDTATVHDPDRCFPLAPPTSPASTPTPAPPPSSAPAATPTSPAASTSHPVLVDRSGGDEVRAWPVRYVRMFDMTNDSHLFRTAAQLEANGFYPVQGNRWKKGEELYLPLYQGKMMQAFDHRC